MPEEVDVAEILGGKTVGALLTPNTFEKHQGLDASPK